MRYSIIIWLLSAFAGHASLNANDSEHFAHSLILSEESLVGLIVLYEKTTSQDVEADLEYSYLINYNSRGTLTKAQFVQTLEALIEIQGLLLVREEDKTISEISGLGRCAAEISPLASADQNGAGARDESEEVRRSGQP
jgi:hypothetical protein